MRSSSTRTSVMTDQRTCSRSADLIEPCMGNGTHKTVEQIGPSLYIIFTSRGVNIEDSNHSRSSTPGSERCRTSAFEWYEDCQQPQEGTMSAG